MRLSGSQALEVLRPGLGLLHRRRELDFDFLRPDPFGGAGEAEESAALEPGRDEEIEERPQVEVLHLQFGRLDAVARRIPLRPEEPAQVTEGVQPGGSERRARPEAQVPRRAETRFIEVHLREREVAPAEADGEASIEDAEAVQPVARPASRRDPDDAREIL